MSTWGAVRLAVGVIVVILGTLLIASAIPAALAATAITSTVGRAGVVAQPLGTLAAAAQDRAVIVDGVSARLDPPATPQWVDGVLALANTSGRSVIEEVGDFDLVATGTTDAGTFIGVADAETVNGLLDGTPYSVAVREGDDWPVISVPGEAVPAAPGTSGTWAASAAGSPARLPAAALTGQTLVLMRPDAGPGPAADLRLEYRVPGAAQALQGAATGAAAASLGGLLLILLGGWLVVGRRPR